MPEAQFAIRPAEPGDLDALEGLMTANATPDDPAYPAGAQHPYLAHLVARGTTVVAHEGARVIGFGAAVDTGRSRHLADLFVDPQRHGRGIGGRLLHAALGDVWPRTTFASDDPRALPLYVRAGMTPLWPNLYLAGDPESVPAGAAGLVVEEASFEEMARLELAWSRVQRAPELPYWASVQDARPFVVRDAGHPVGVGLSRRRLTGVGSWLDHVRVGPDVDPAPVLLAAFRDGAAGARETGGCVPGPSPALRPLLEAGFTIRDRDTFLGSDPTLVDARREVVNTGLL